MSTRVSRAAGRASRFALAAGGRARRSRSCSSACWRSCCRSSSTRSRASSTTRSSRSPTSSWRSGSTSSSASPACSTSATSPSSRSAPTRSAGSGRGSSSTPTSTCSSRGRVHNLPGIHVNFLLVLVIAALLCALAGTLIGLPTLRLRGDYIAIVTLAFGEIIGVFAVNGDDDHDRQRRDADRGPPGHHAGRPGQAAVPGPVHPAEPQTVVLAHPRDRLRRAVRRTSACATRGSAAPGSRSARTRSRRRRWACRWSRRSCWPTRSAPPSAACRAPSWPAYLNTVNADQFAFSFSIFVLAMVILGGLGSIWGVVLGAILLSFVNNRLIPDVLNSVPGKLGLNFSSPTWASASSASCS